MRWYNAPQGRLGLHFVHKLTSELKGFLNRGWNSDKLLVFVDIILHTRENIRSLKDICAHRAEDGILVPDIPCGTGRQYRQC